MTLTDNCRGRGLCPLAYPPVIKPTTIEDSWPDKKKSGDVYFTFVLLIAVVVSLSKQES